MNEYYRAQTLKKVEWVKKRGHTQYRNYRNDELSERWVYWDRNDTKDLYYFNAIWQWLGSHTVL